MEITLAMVTPRRGLTGPAAELIALFLGRAQRYVPASLRLVATEARLLEQLEEAGGRRRPVLLLADSRGQQVSSEELAGLVGRQMDEGVQSLVLAIGPADGWSAAALGRADKAIAFGRITLPHELAGVVAAEQLYRALAIRAGHPYHGGH